LRTRRREEIFLTTCLASRQRFVVDNTNPTRSDRAVYIQAAREKKFTVVCYYFAARIEDALARNALRSGKACVPDSVIWNALSKQERPSLSEGFDALYQVTIVDGEFIVSELEPQ
jgi:predicted kinase